MYIFDWFDVNDMNHLMAYKHLQWTGLWPDGFLPDDVEYIPSWQVAIDHKLALAYVDEKLQNPYADVISE